MTQTDFPQEALTRAKSIQLLLLDVDGVLTDGRLFFDNSGNELKSFHTLDGHGIKMLQKSGVMVGIITGRQSHLVERRAKDLGIRILIQGREDKWQAALEILEQHPVPYQNIAFMGDDYPDLTVMTKVGLAMTVANALPAMQKHSHWQSRFPGGGGAVREACDLIMSAQGTYLEALEEYTSA